MVDIVESMRSEDSWLGSKSLGDLIDIFIPSDVSGAIRKFEPELGDSRYKDSAALHFLLGNFYGCLNEELSEDVRREIEIESLRKSGNDYLADNLDVDTEKIKEMFSDKMVNLGTKRHPWYINLEASNFYLSQRNANTRIGLLNNVRQFGHFEKSLELSGNNPSVFNELISPKVIPYVIGINAIAGESGNLGSSFMARNFAEKYELAKKRIDSLVA